jgi:hypothetical protein
MSAVRHVLEILVLPMWLVILALLVLAVLVSFFVIGPNFPDRGATPLAGAKLPWDSPGHETQLRQYHDLCVREGRSLVWSSYMRAFMASWLWLTAGSNRPQPPGRRILITLGHMARSTVSLVNDPVRRPCRSPGASRTAV